MKNYKKIGVRVFIGELILSALFLSVIGIIKYRTWNRLYEKEVQYYIEITNSTKEQLKMVFDMVEDYMHEFKKNYSINLILRSLTEKEDTSVQEIQEKLKTVAEFNNNIGDIHILGVNDYRFSSNLYYEETLSKGTIYEWYLSYYMQNTDRKGAWTQLHLKEDGTYSSLVSYISPVFDTNTKELYGIIAIDLTYESIHKIFTTSCIKLHDKAVIISKEGDILLQYPMQASYVNILEKYPQVKDGDVQFEGVFNKQKVVILSQKLNTNDWCQVRIIPLSTATKDIETVFSKINSMIMVTLLLSLLYTIFLTKSIISPLNKLTNVCNKLKKGDFTVKANIKNQDEIGHFADTFNSMVDRINDMFEREQKEQQRKSEMEYQVLLAQVNPHFLYNTLDSMKWLASMQGVDNIAQMSTALINLLKYNLGKVDSDITLQMELESVKNYITLQKYRYSNIFEFTTDIDQDTLICRVPRFTLQPLVENCILHGFNEEKDNYRIHIISKIHDDFLHIKVIDNGTGLDKEEQELLNSGTKKTMRFSKIGVQSIRERLQMQFGVECKLTFSSSPNFATIAEIIIPLYKCKVSN